MAKLLVEVDTDTDSITVTLNGVVIPAIENVSVFWDSWDSDGDGLSPEPRFEIVAREKRGDYQVCTRTIASDIAARAALQGEPSPHIGFVTIVTPFLTKAQKAVAELLGYKSK